jgi:5-formyltetrahydrofolate cyclo-ligase
MSTLRLQKRALRRTLLATLGALAPAALAEQSGAVAAHLFATAAWTRARAVGVFVGAAGEVATDAVVRRGLAEGASLCASRCRAPLTLRRQAHLHSALYPRARRRGGAGAEELCARHAHAAPARRRRV